MVGPNMVATLNLLTFFVIFGVHVVRIFVMATTEARGSGASTPAICFGRIGKPACTYESHENSIIVNSTSQPRQYNLAAGQQCWEVCWLHESECALALLNNTKQCWLYRDGKIWKEVTAGRSSVYAPEDCPSSRCDKQKAKESGYWVKYSRPIYKTLWHIFDIHKSSESDCLEICLRHPTCNFVIVQDKNHSHWSTYGDLQKDWKVCTLTETKMQPLNGILRGVSYFWHECTFSPLEVTIEKIRPLQVNVSCRGVFMSIGNRSLSDSGMLYSLDIQNQERCINACTVTPRCHYAMFSNVSKKYNTDLRWVCFLLKAAASHINASHNNDSLLYGQTWEWRCRGEKPTARGVDCRCIIDNNTLIYDNNCGSLRNISYRLLESTAVLIAGTEQNFDGVRYLKVAQPIRLTPSSVHGGWVSADSVVSCHADNCRYYFLRNQQFNVHRCERRDWYYAEQRCAPKRFPRTPKTLVVTNTQTLDKAPCYGIVCPSIIRSIQKVHQRNRNRCFLSSNYYISNDGVVYEGLGAHFIPQIDGMYAEKVIQVSFVGNFKLYMPSWKAIEALRVLAKDLVNNESITRPFKLITRLDMDHKYNITVPGIALRSVIHALPGTLWDVADWGYPCSKRLQWYQIGAFFVLCFTCVVLLACLIIVLLVLQRSSGHTVAVKLWIKVPAESSVAMMRDNRVPGVRGTQKVVGSTHLRTISTVTVTSSCVEDYLCLNREFDDFVKRDLTLESLLEREPNMLEFRNSLWILFSSIGDRAQLHFITNIGDTDVSGLCEVLMVSDFSKLSKIGSAKTFFIRREGEYVRPPGRLFSGRKTFGSYVGVLRDYDARLQYVHEWLREAAGVLR